MREANEDVAINIKERETGKRRGFQCLIILFMYCPGPETRAPLTAQPVVFQPVATS